MRLLIVTQAVDREDPSLGFFLRWIEALSKTSEEVNVICLKKGDFSLPPNVRVHSLGKEMRQSRLRYVVLFFRFIFSLRYDVVFVHMNEEYLLLGGFWWRLTGKRVLFWRNHRMGTWKTKVAASFAQHIFYTSPDAFVARISGAQRMAIGIDTERFFPAAIPPQFASVLFFGRLDPVKKPELFIDALHLLSQRGIDFHAALYGDPTYDSAYKRELEKRAEQLIISGKLSFNGAVTNEEAPALYQRYAVYVNTTPSGSFDKTIGEAMASGCLIVALNRALTDVVPQELLAEEDAQSVAKSLEYALTCPPARVEELRRRFRDYVLEEQSLTQVVERISQIALESTT